MLAILEEEVKSRALVALALMDGFGSPWCNFEHSTANVAVAGGMVLKVL